ncbi:hypothetical protein MKI84_17140 [Ancylobacter sp. A5.8]|uniref:cell division protein FtsL n=1 Tax=Ancylobacter gelatini TaxID=2919920 RepID=UPI001F4D996E|nr:hypothetical protein [Ancylobacter gelatini]MCJ8144650.1 hypothetical protein [Ancylobacter gelatini]
MFRILNFVSVIALLAAAGAVYHVKYSAAFEAQKIAALRGEIRYERDRIATLNAEWARRTAPDRVQALAEHHLEMQPLDITRMDKLASLPAKPEQNGDALGGMIEALVDGPSGGINSILGGTGKEAEKPRPAALRPAPRPAVSSGQPLPLSAMPAAGVMAPQRPVFNAGPQGAIGAPLNPAASRPLLPPAAVGQ